MWRSRQACAMMEKENVDETRSEEKVLSGLAS